MQWGASEAPVTGGAGRRRAHAEQMRQMAAVDAHITPPVRSSAPSSTMWQSLWASALVGVCALVVMTPAPAQAAGVAALGDLEFAGRARAFNDQWRPWLADQLTALGLEPLGSEGNFILVRFPGDAGRTAAAADAFLYDRGIILRNVDGYGFPDCLRVSVGQEDENRELITALNQFMSAA